MTAQPVIGGPLFSILKRRISLSRVVDLTLRLFRRVREALSRKVSISLLDLVLARSAANAKDGAIVFELHRQAAR